jgi:hypothetical protein
MLQRHGLRLANAFKWGRSLGRLLRFSILLAGLGLIPAAGHAAAPMSFSVTRLGTETGGACGRTCVDVITAQGEINNETADDFVAFLSSHAQEQDLRPVVLIESPGGTVVGAMQLGMVFRKIGAEVIVGEAVSVRGSDRVGLAPGLCMSACVYAFFGGKERVVPNISRLGIHRMVINESFRDPSGGYARQQTFGTEDIVSSLAAYTRMMGIDPEVIRYAETVAPESIHIVTPREIARWRLARAHL